MTSHTTPTRWWPALLLAVVLGVTAPTFTLAQDDGAIDAAEEVGKEVTDGMTESVDAAEGAVDGAVDKAAAIGDEVAEETDATGDDAADEASEDKAESRTFGESFNQYLGKFNDFCFGIMFFDVSFDLFKSPALDESGKPIQDKDGEPVLEGPSAPFLVVFLALGAIFFTFYHGWINVRGFKHAINIVRGKYTSGDDEGDIPPFRALTSALSATVGLGNISGVAIAVFSGGPGAIFWMMFLGLFGMSAKFHESTLAQMFRAKNKDGSVSGGPMFYLDRGMREYGPVLGGLGKVLAIVFAMFCMTAALGGGNMYQANQAFEGFYTTFVAEPGIVDQAKDDMSADELRKLVTPKQLTAARDFKRLDQDTPLENVRAGLSEAELRDIVLPSQVATTMDADAVKSDTDARDARKARVAWGFGIVMATLVGVVVIGGITRIGAATSKIVPTMCLLYVIGCLIVILFNAHEIPGHVKLIFTEAFKLKSAAGGIVGVLIIGFQRAAFSSESGLGSSAIAHSAAKAKHPVSEGFVASLEPFIDTIIICFMTAMVVLITDAYRAPQFAEEFSGTSITLYGFEQTRIGGWFPLVLSISVVLFAFSTQISWCYYGERAWGYLFGMKTIIVFRLIFVAAVVIGTVASLEQVLGFSDVMLLSMAFPNIVGGIILAPKVKRKVEEYWNAYRDNDLDRLEPSDTFEI